MYKKHKTKKELNNALNRVTLNFKCFYILSITNFNII